MIRIIYFEKHFFDKDKYLKIFLKRNKLKGEIVKSARTGLVKIDVATLLQSITLLILGTCV